MTDIVANVPIDIGGETYRYSPVTVAGKAEPHQEQPGPSVSIEVVNYSSNLVLVAFEGISSITDNWDMVVPAWTGRVQAYTGSGQLSTVLVGSGATSGPHDQVMVMLSADKAPPAYYTLPQAVQVSGNVSIAGTVPVTGNVGITGSVPIMPPSLYSDVVLADAPLVYYRLDEEGSTTARDTSGNGRDGAYTLTNVVQGQTGATADSDPAIHIAGAGVTYPNGTGLPTGAAARSIEWWFKAPSGAFGSAGVQRHFLGWGTVATSQQMQVTSLNGPNQIALGYNGAGAAVFSGLTLDDNRWHHCVLTFNPTDTTAGANGTVKLYMDGVAVGGNLAIPAGVNTTLSAAGLILGADVAGGNPYTGYLDDVAIYGTVLTQAKVTAHYNAASSKVMTVGLSGGSEVGISGTVGVQNGGIYRQAVLADTPAVYYRLGEASGTVMADSSNNGHTGAYTANAGLSHVGAVKDADAAITVNGTSGTYAAGTGLPTGTAARTVELWYKAAPGHLTAAQTYLLDYGSNTTMGDVQILFITDSTTFALGWNGTGACIWSGLPATDDGRWHYLAVTVNPADTSAGANGTAHLYLNGIDRGGKPVPAGVVTGSSAGLVLGSDLSGGHPFTGYLDEVAVYPAALNLAQILTHFEAAYGFTVVHPTTIPVGNPSGGSLTVDNPNPLDVQNTSGGSLTVLHPTTLPVGNPSGGSLTVDHPNTLSVQNPTGGALTVKQAQPIKETVGFVNNLSSTNHPLTIARITKPAALFGGGGGVSSLSNRTTGTVGQLQIWLSGATSGTIVTIGWASAPGPGEDVTLPPILFSPPLDLNSMMPSDSQVDIIADIPDAATTATMRAAFYLYTS